jgi:Xaa-Pro aminopeptidase
MSAEAGLLEAQGKASALFAVIERELLRPGVGEAQLSEEIYALAERDFGVATHWHKRVIRGGENTLQPYSENPPDRLLAEDDILFVDLGPVFEAWEADFGRTYVLGHDPLKLKLRDDLEPIFNAVKAQYQARPDMTGEELYLLACEHAVQAGWEFGGSIAGHLVGAFPHERIEGNKLRFYIARGNHHRLNEPTDNGQKRHWILEIHLVDRARRIGGFYEQLLTI